MGTGGEPNRTIPLSDLEERIVSVIRTVAVERIPEVRVPFDVSTAFNVSDCMFLKDHEFLTETYKIL